MADNKQYITQVQENGNVLISEDVITTIVSHALGEVEGVAGPGKKGWSKAVKLTISQEDALVIECSILVEYGQAVVQIANAAQTAIIGAIDSMTGVKVTAVNINVSGIVRK